MEGTSDSPIALSTDELYKNKQGDNAVYVDIPGAKGVELIILSGPTVRKVVQRYNLLSGEDVCHHYGDWALNIE
jgi:hypothetical protein